MTLYANPDFAPKHTLFVLKFEDERSSDVFVLRVAPDGTNAWSGRLFPEEDHDEGMRGVLTGFLNERLQAAGLGTASGGFTVVESSEERPGAYVLHHTVQVDDLDGQAVEPLVQRWRAVLADTLNVREVPARSVGAAHRLNEEERGLLASPVALADALAAKDPAVPVPSRVALHLKRSPWVVPRVPLLMCVRTDEGGWGGIGLPLNALLLDSSDYGRPLTLAETAFRLLQEVSMEHPGTVRWQGDHAQQPVRLGTNVRSFGFVQEAEVFDLPMATLKAADAQSTLERLQAKLRSFTEGHTGIAWCVPAGSDAAHNLDALVMETRERLIEHLSAGKTTPEPDVSTSGLKPGRR